MKKPALPKAVNDKPVAPGPGIPTEKTTAAKTKPMVAGSKKVTGSDIFGGRTPPSAVDIPAELKGPDKDKQIKDEAKKQVNKLQGRQVFSVGATPGS